MNATVICETRISVYRKGICLNRTINDVFNIKRKEILKKIKYSIKNKSSKVIFIEFIIINHSEKKVEYITECFKILKLKDRYYQELKNLERGWYIQLKNLQI